MLPWPATLPQVPLVDGYREVFEDRRVVGPTEIGPRKVRPRSTSTLRAFTMVFGLTVAQVATLKTFWQVDTRVGEDRFTFPHPRTQASIEIRFTAPPMLQPWTPTDWRASVEGDALLAIVGTGSLVWPASLPVAPLIDAYDEEFADLALVSDLPGGVSERRRRAMAAVTPIRTMLRLTGTEVTTFEALYEGDTVGGCLPFTWTHPRDGSVRAAFAGGPELRALGGDLYEIGFSLEVLP